MTVFKTPKVIHLKLKIFLQPEMRYRFEKHQNLTYFNAKKVNRKN